MPPRTDANLELIVLCVLSESDAYGYAITKKIHARGNQGEVSINAGPGVLYPLLKRLEKQGLVAARWETIRSQRVEDGGEGRRRKWYSLTPKGRRRLEQGVSAHRAHVALMESFIAGGER